MPSRKEKEAMVQVLRDKFKSSKVTILADYRGLDVGSMTRLRRKLGDADSELRVVKNTITKLVAKEIGLKELEQYLKGPTAIAFGFQDLVSPAKIILDFTYEYKLMEIKGGVLEGKVIDAQIVKKLAELPPREVLVAKVMGGFQSPLFNLVLVLQGNIRKFIYVLEALRRQQSGEVV